MNNNKLLYINYKKEYLKNTFLIGGVNESKMNKNKEQKGQGLINAHGSIYSNDKNIQYCIIPDNMTIRVCCKNGEIFYPLVGGYMLYELKNQIQNTNLSKKIENLIKYYNNYIINVNLTTYNSLIQYIDSIVTQNNDIKNYLIH